MKRIAMVLAVLSVFSFAACGSEKKEDTSSAQVTEKVTEQAAQGQTPDTDISEDGSEAPAQNSESSVTPDNGGENGGAAVYTDGNAAVIMQDGDAAPELTQEELDDMTSLALKQYEAILNDDAEAYFDIVNLNGFFTDERLEKLLDGQEHDSVTNLVINRFSEFAAEASFSEDGDDEGAEVDNMKDYLLLLSKKATPENFKRRMSEDDDIFSYQYTREDLSLLKEEGKDGSISENAVYIMLDPYIAREGGDLYASFEIAVLDGDTAYDLDDIVYWNSGSESGLYIDECFHTENEYKGMSVQEITEALQTGLSDSETEQSARAFYNAAETYLEENGKDIDSALAAGDFEKAFSAEGLDLGGTAEASGDKALLALLEYYEYKGSVFVGSENRTLFVQYKNDSGEIGQVPAPQNTGAQIVWGKYTR